MTNSVYGIGFTSFTNKIQGFNYIIYIYIVTKLFQI